MRIFSRVLIALAASNAFSKSICTEEIIEIRTWQQLQAMQDNLCADYVLINNIDIPTGINFVPVGGRDGIPFKGSFDGRGYTIRNLHINVDALEGVSQVGLFGDVVSSKEFKNVTIITSEDGIRGYEAETATFIGKYSPAQKNVMLKNIHIRGHIHNQSSPTDGLAGGVVGRIGLVNQHIILKDLSFTGGIEGNSIGGIVAHINAGYNSSVVLQGCYVRNTNFRFKDTVNQYNMGGLLGEFFLYYTAEAALNEKPLSIISSYVVDTVFHNPNPRGMEVIGGLFARFRAESDYSPREPVIIELSDSYVAARFQTQTQVIGVLFGTMRGINPSISEIIYINTSVIYNAEIAPDIPSNGNMIQNDRIFPLTTNAMKLKDTYMILGWDMASVWDINPQINNGYPYGRSNIPLLRVVQ